MKYNTLAKLAAAYKSGELAEDDPLWLDNDTAFVYVSDADGESTASPAGAAPADTALVTVYAICIAVG